MTDAPHGEASGSPPVAVYVSIGSNVDRARNVRGALAALEAAFGALRVSPVYEGPAVGFDGPPFYNLVVGFETRQPPEAVVEALRRIEAQHGRRRGRRRFADRSLDLDILLYGDLVRHDQGLDLPRGEITRHAYVLRPLADLAGHLRHPESGRTFAELWSQFDPAAEDLRRVDLP